MATYKVLQDIEAEDKLLGPLTLRQFIYACITVASGFIAFRLMLLQWFLALPFLPPVVLFGVLAAPFGQDQSSEVWLLAKIRFALKPRKRIWDQSGASDLVSITVPKRIERQLTNNLSQTEVRSRLHALATTIDSRGWAVKNAAVSMYGQQSYVNAQASDRLVNPSMLPQDVPNFDITAADDMLDAASNPTAQHFQQMIAASAQAHRQQVVAQMQGRQPAQPAHQAAGPPPNYWFMNQTVPQQPVPPGYATFAPQPVVAPGAPLPATAPQPANPTPYEEQLVHQLQAIKQQTNPMHSHVKKIEPLSEQHPANAEAISQTNPMTATPDPAILSLASNDDLSVATIARQAQARKQPPEDDGEVVVSLR